MWRHDGVLPGSSSSSSGGGDGSLLNTLAHGGRVVRESPCVRDSLVCFASPKRDYRLHDHRPGGPEDVVARLRGAHVVRRGRWRRRDIERAVR